MGLVSCGDTILGILFGGMPGKRNQGERQRLLGKQYFCFCPRIPEQFRLAVTLQHWCGLPVAQGAENVRLVRVPQQFQMQAARKIPDAWLRLAEDFQKFRHFFRPESHAHDSDQHWLGRGLVSIGQPTPRRKQYRWERPNSPAAFRMFPDGLQTKGRFFNNRISRPRRTSQARHPRFRPENNPCG